MNFKTLSLTFSTPSNQMTLPTAGGSIVYSLLIQCPIAANFNTVSGLEPAMKGETNCMTRGTRSTRLTINQLTTRCTKVNTVKDKDILSAGKHASERSSS